MLELCCARVCARPLLIGSKTHNTDGGVRVVRRRNEKSLAASRRVLPIIWLQDNGDWGGEWYARDMAYGFDTLMENVAGERDGQAGEERGAVSGGSVAPSVSTERQVLVAFVKVTVAGTTKAATHRVTPPRPSIVFPVFSLPCAVLCCLCLIRHSSHPLRAPRQYWKPSLGVPDGHGNG